MSRPRPLAVSIVVALVWAVATGSASPPALAADDDPAAPAVASPGDSPAPPPARTAHPLDRAADALASLVPLVEKACGACFDAPPHVVETTPEKAARIFAADMRPEYERRYPTLTPRQIGTMLDLAASASVRSSLARYSFEAKAIVLVREAFDAQCAALGRTGDAAAHVLAMTLAHECVHALDDARFGLAALYRGAADDEALRALAMIAEGRAVRFGGIAAKAAGVPADVVAILPGGAAPKGEREWHLNLTYRLGAQFVAAIAERGGVALADRAMKEPPASTWFVCRPSRWPDGCPDPRPAALLARAGLGDASKPLSNLQLLERYAASSGLEAAETLFDHFAGGAQALADGTNHAVLAFADEEAAKRYEAVSATEAATHREGTLVLRTIGGEKSARLARLVEALEPPTGTK